MPIVGIDLGTTNSLISYWKDNKCIMIPNALGNNLTPSVVSIDDQDEIIVGEIAKERLITHPDRTVQAFKRYMGSTKEIQLGKYKFLPEELSSFVIKSLIQDAEAYFGEKITEAVISVPAYFNDAQRKATKRAGELAGLRVDRLINEPTAAATAYGLHQQESETKFLVFDLGGGTFDVSIVEIFENVLEVQAIAGDNYLGGEDFTKILVDTFMEKHRLDPLTLDHKVYAAIQKQAEVCKKSLGDIKRGSISCTIEGEELRWELDHREYELIAKPLLLRLRHPIEKALRDAGLKARDLDEIILVGGATRMPLVHTLVSKMFGRFPACSVNPDEVVAAGSGIQAAMKERNSLLKEVVLTDVCPYTLGTEIVVRNSLGQYESGHFSPIIERNTVIPVSKVKTYYTICDNQNKVAIEVFQGEGRLTKNNIKLGELEVQVPPAPAGEQFVNVRFTYDINSILEVEVEVAGTGEKKSMIIEGSPGTMSKEEIKQRLEALSHIKIHPRERQENKLLLARAERLYEESLGDVRPLIDRMISDFEAVLAKQDEKEIKKTSKRFKEELDRLEEGVDFF